MEVFYKQALTIRNQFMFLIGERFMMNAENFTIKDIIVVPADIKKQDDFFKNHDILPYITEKCDLAVTLSNEHYKSHYPYLTLESLLKVHKIDFNLEEHLHLKYSMM